ncbi:MAG: hypothetical protein MJ203_02580 [archaeon]|nr:hypothetical protein [archaeon]
MKPLNFKYQYFALFFIFLFISIGSVAASDDCTDENRDLSSYIMVSSDVVDSVNNIRVSNVDSINNSDFTINSSNEFISKKVNPKEDICSVGASKTTKTVISSKSLSINYGADGYVVGYLKTSSGKAIKSKVVKITLNSQTWSKTTDSNGKISLKIPLLNPNTYSVKLSFAACSGYSASSCLVNVTINKLATKITSNDVYAYNNNSLVAYLKDSKNNPLKSKLVKFTIDGNSYNAFSDSNGQIIFNIPSYLKAKNYSSTIKFVGDKYYSSSSKSVKVYKFDNSNIESFIGELVSSKEFKQLFSNASSNQASLNNSSTLQNSSQLAITQLLDNLTGEELESINQFLNLISSDNLNTIDLSKLDSTMFKDLNLAVSNEQNNKKNIIESIWKWLNTPILEIPGYSDLDKKYGVFGQGLKLAGWFLLGIDDNGGLTPLDIGLDALSICSGAGLCERLGISSSSLILKLTNKFPRLDGLLKSAVKIKGLDYSITIKSLFTAYKSGLSILNNPIKFVSNKVISNALDRWDNKLASFAMGYISNSFLTVSSVLGIGEVYVNSKENSIFTTKILSNITNSNNIKLIINDSTSPIASTIKNLKSSVDSISKTVSDVSKAVSKTVATVKNTVSSTVKKVTTAVKSVSKTVSKAVKNVATKVKKTVKKVTKTVKKAVKNVATKVKKTVKKVVKTVKKAVKTTISVAKKKVNSISTPIKKIKLW